MYLGLQTEAAKAALGLHNDAADAAQKRKIELEAVQVENQRRLLEAAEGRSSDQILALALHQHPEFAQAFVAAQQVQAMVTSRDQQLQLQSDFQKQLEKAYGQTPALISGLAKEAVKQSGAVQSEVRRRPPAGRRPGAPREIGTGRLGDGRADEMNAAPAGRVPGRGGFVNGYGSDRSGPASANDRPRPGSPGHANERPDDQ